MDEYINPEKDRYIKLSQALEVLDSCACWWAHERMENIPAADVVEQKHGKWIDMGDFEMCSVCKGTHLKRFQSYYGDVTWIKTDFCPNCGARMDLESSVGKEGIKT